MTDSIEERHRRFIAEARFWLWLDREMNESSEGRYWVRVFELWNGA